MKTIFISGAATGIGRACIDKFLAEGWCVAVMDLCEVTGSFPADRFLFSLGDVRNREAVQIAVALAVERFGGLDAVFSNAGIHQSNSLLTVTDEELSRIIDINILGTVNVLRAAAPELIRRGGGSVVINCSDQWYVGKANNFAYGLTKGALGQITRSLSVELAPHKVRVNAICPGTIDTPILDRALSRASERTGIPVEQLREEENSLFPLGRIGRTDEVANLVFFLASDASSFCTGGHYLIDGGLTASR